MMHPEGGYMGMGASVFDDDDGDDGTPHAAKKFKHNVAERRRTSRLNSLFDELSVLLSSRPDIFCDSGMRHSKADVSTTLEDEHH